MGVDMYASYYNPTPNITAFNNPIEQYKSYYTNHANRIIEAQTDKVEEPNKDVEKNKEINKEEEESLLKMIKDYGKIYNHTTYLIIAFVVVILYQSYLLNRTIKLLTFNIHQFKSGSGQSDIMQYYL